jgi:hypothetical protein
MERHAIVALVRLGERSHQRFLKLDAEIPLGEQHHQALEIRFGKGGKGRIGLEQI